MVNRRKFLGLVGLTLVSGSASAITIGDSGGIIPEPASAVYKTREGETLSAISKRLYGTNNYWKEIYDSNKKRIGKDPNCIEPETLIEINYDRALTYFESQFEELPEKSNPRAGHIING